MEVQLGDTRVRVEDIEEFCGIRITDDENEIEIICANPGIRPSVVKVHDASLWIA